jgi:YD repeat-containing protein
MTSKSKLWSFIFIFISGAILLFPFVVYAQTPIDCGQTLAGTISAAGQRNSYTFSASADDGITIRVRKTSGTLTAYIELYGPGGGVITGATNKIDRILTQAGTYRIDVRDQNNTNTGDYVLYWERMNSPCNATAISCGQVLTGSIGTSADPPPWRAYTFTGTAGDAVSIRSFKIGTSSFVSYMDLYGPNGAYITYKYNYPLDTTLSTTGTYTVVIRDYYNAYAGDFFLTYQLMSNPCNAVPINCGQVVSSSIDAPREMDVYTFTVSANDGIVIRARKISGTFSLYLEFYNASGVKVSEPGTEWKGILTVPGTYKIIVRDSSYTNTGNYLLYWERMNNPCNATPISCGQVLTGSIGTSADPPPWKAYIFTGTAGDAVSIRSYRIGTGSLVPYMELYGPNGAYITYKYNYPLDATLSTTGTYTVLIRDYYNAYAGDFFVTYQVMSNPCNAAPINCGQVVSSSIDAPREMDVYTFTASANDGVTIRVRKTSGSISPRIELYGPTGGSVVGPTANQIDYKPTAAGTYKIIVRDSSYVNTGNYLLYLERMNNPCNATPISCGQVLTGSIGTSTDPPPWKAYAFTGTVGDAVSIRSLKTSAGTFVSYMELYGPNGGYIGGYYNYPLERTLAATGTHTILIRDYYNANAGDFFLTYQVMNNPCNATPINCGQVAEGSIDSLREMDAYTFTVSANDVVTIGARKISGGLTPYLELYNPSGGWIWRGSPPWTGNLTTAGTYKVLIRDSSYGNTGSYVVYWQRWNNPCASALSCGQMTTGSIGGAADPPFLRYYSFNALANDSVTIRATKTSGTLTPYLELYNASGTQIGTGAGQLDKALTAAGIYTVVVRDQNSINTGEYLLTWLKVNNPCSFTPIGCGQVLQGSVDTVGEIDAYTLTATGGDNVVLTLTKTSGGLDPSVELYNSSGARVGYQYSASGNQVTITQTLATGGTYTVFVSDYGNDESGSYTLKFQKNNNICPEVTLTVPNGGDRLAATSNFTIRWTCTSSQGINSQEINLSTDGGQTFPNIIATGLQGDVRSYNWTVPQEMVTTQGRIRITVTDTSGMSTFDDTDSNFEIYQGVGRIYVYDELNRLIQVIYEDGRRVTYTYDASGNRITLTNEE